MNKLKFESKLAALPLIAFTLLLTISVSGSVPDEFIILFVMLTLAEPHFAASWPYILDQKYRELFIKDKTNLIFIPLGIFISSILIFTLLGSEIFSYLFLFANLYHVNRQSLGLLKLLGLKKSAYEQSNFDCHIPSVLFLAYHFYFLKSGSGPIYIPIALMVVAFIYVLARLPFDNSNTTSFGRKLGFFSSQLQLVLIWSTLLFFTNPILALAIGVSIHYVQYLLFTTHIFHHEIKLRSFILFIIFYTCATGTAQTIGVRVFEWLILFAAIPQLLHFYLDGHFWKFSNKNVRERIVPAFFEGRLKNEK